MAPPITRAQAKRIERRENRTPYALRPEKRGQLKNKSIRQSDDPCQRPKIVDNYPFCLDEISPTKKHYFSSNNLQDTYPAYKTLIYPSCDYYACKTGRKIVRLEPLGEVVPNIRDTRCAVSKTGVPWVRKGIFEFGWGVPHDDLPLSMELYNVYEQTGNHIKIFDRGYRIPSFYDVEYYNESLYGEYDVEPLKCIAGQQNESIACDIQREVGLRENCDEYLPTPNATNTTTTPTVPQIGSSSQLGSTLGLAGALGGSVVVFCAVCYGAYRFVNWLLDVDTKKQKKLKDMSVKLQKNRA